MKNSIVFAKTVNDKLKCKEEADDDFRNLYNWIVELNHEKWDRRIEEDSDMGLLDHLANQAVADYRKGLSAEL